MGEPSAKKQLMERRIAAFVLGLLLFPANLVGLIRLFGNRAMSGSYYGEGYLASLGETALIILGIVAFFSALLPAFLLLLMLRTRQTDIKMQMLSSRMSPSQAERRLVRGGLLFVGLWLMLSGAAQMVPYLVFEDGFPDYPAYFILNILGGIVLVGIGCWPRGFKPTDDSNSRFLS